MQPPQRYATAIGQQHDVALEDGSRVRLDTNSALVVRYSRKHRDVVLERGRAQFDVAHAPQRPFTVHAGPGTVRAVGTQFQVRHQDDAVQVIRSEEHTSELQSLMRNSYAVFCLKKKIIQETLQHKNVVI